MWNFFTNSKKNILIFWSFLIGVVLIPSIIFVISNIFFFFWKYEISQKINTTLGEVFPYNQNLLLKQADFFYKKQDFQTALLYYLWIECKNEKTCFLLWHNLGNTYYKFWDLQESRDVKINFWKKSLESYSQALEIKNDQKTQSNYDFVRKKLEELLEEQQQEQQEQQEEQQENSQEQEQNNPQNEEDSQQEQNENQENSWEENSQDSQESQEQSKENQSQNNSWENSQNWQPQPQSWNQDSQNSQEWEQIPTSQNPNFWLGWNEEEWFAPLTPDEREMILDQLERLKQEELQNRELNKPGNYNNLFDQFGIENFFNNRPNQDW